MKKSASLRTFHHDQEQHPQHEARSFPGSFRFHTSLGKGAHVPGGIGVAIAPTLLGPLVGVLRVGVLYLFFQCIFQGYGLGFGLSIGIHTWRRRCSRSASPSGTAWSSTASGSPRAGDTRASAAPSASASHLSSGLRPPVFNYPSRLKGQSV